MTKVFFILSIIAPSLLISTAWADDSAPRRSYQNQTCHNSTAGIIKKSLKQDAKNVDDFCGCIANKVVARISQPDDHTYALAYHEANIIVERTERYNQSKSEIGRELFVRSKGYESDLGISLKDLEAHMEPALTDVSYCVDNTPKSLTTISSFPALRGRFPAS